MSFSTVLRVLCTLSTICIAKGACPAMENIYPCTCKTDSSDSLRVQCNNIDNARDFRIAMESLIGKKVATVIIKDGTLHFLPHDLFKGLASLDEIELLESSFFSLSDQDTAFVGLENSLGVLTITDCRFMSGWDWTHLKDLKTLFRIDILGGDMDSIGEEIASIHHLPIVDLAFSRNKISWISDGAFVKYDKLISLSLDHNELAEIKRSTLPNPADQFMLLDLAYNKLKYLDDDLFSNMPSLNTVSLGHNLLTTLEENTFSPIWRQLELFEALGNPISCDCRLAWVTEIKTTPDHRVVCEQPDTLKGKLIQSLKRKQLHC